MSVPAASMAAAPHLPCPFVHVFKNLIVHRLGPQPLPDVAAVQAALEKMRFVPCAPTQPLSLGWVEPRGEPHAPLVEVVAGHWIMELRFEQKLLPSSVVRQRAEERAGQIEQATGRRPGKRQMKELKEEVTLDLLPQAFTRQAGVRVWIDTRARRMMLDAGSSARADAAVTALVKAIEGLAPMPLATLESPGAAMAAWLGEGEGPAAFSIDRDCELKAPDESRAAVRYARHPLDTNEVRAHIAAGKRPTRLALTWRGRVSFALHDNGQLKRLALVDDVFESEAATPGGFDADAAIATGEFAPLIDDLIEALGGPAPEPVAA